ncbi:hypothetical protein ACIG0D_20800 [Streptomyces sp. NPDC052773]|uniref:hypothetical protein n=1 Tax=Streptomyces sp. NPDC052773 TaxID=3365693 RepID=UPI0037D0E253
MNGSARRLSRHSLALCACVALVAGCGDSAQETSPLDARQTKAVLPNAEALPGWKVGLEPVAYPLKKAKEMGVARCYQGAEECAKIQFAGVSEAHGSGKPSLGFVLMTYEDSVAAEKAYEPVWKSWSERSIERRELSLGDIGDESDAVTGLSASYEAGAKTLFAQVRVGSVIMLTLGEAGADIELQNWVKKCAVVFAERAEQAQQGETPYATLDDVA